MNTKIKIIKVTEWRRINFTIDGKHYSISDSCDEYGYTSLRCKETEFCKYLSLDTCDILNYITKTDVINKHGRTYSETFSKHKLLLLQDYVLAVVNGFKEESTPLHYLIKEKQLLNIIESYKNKLQKCKETRVENKSKYKQLYSERMKIMPLGGIIDE